MAFLLVVSTALCNSWGHFCQNFLRWRYLNWSPCGRMRWVSCTDLNGEDSCVSDQERFHLESLAEGGGLVHCSHRRCLICINVLPQLVSAQKSSQLEVCGLFQFIGLRSTQRQQERFSGGRLLSHSFQQHLLNLGHTSGASHQNHLLNFILWTWLKDLDPQQ